MRNAESFSKEITFTHKNIVNILTAVSKVCIKYNTPDEKALDELTLAEAQEYIDASEFAKGSMLPKVEACMDFVRGNSGKKAIIGSLEKARDAINGLSGTVIKD